MGACVATTRGSYRGPSCDEPLGHQGRSAFTLIELLIVIFIIGLLVMVLVPSLVGAREHAYNSICQGNLEKLGVALHTHGAENPTALPAPSAWIAAASGKGGKDVLKCPKGYFHGGLGGLAGTTPNVEQVKTPSSAVFNDLESNTRIHAFPERENYTLPQDVTVDISAPGDYDHGYRQTAKVIPAGTMVNCHFLHYDPVGSQWATSAGAISVSGEILGLIVTSGQLDATDHILGAPGTAYPTGQGARGFENRAEIVRLEADMRTFTINRFQSTFPGEQVRILSVPTGTASYGMNNQVSSQGPRMQQLLLVEYNKAVVDFNGKLPDDDPNEMLRPRHFGKANVLFVNGSVRLMWPDKLEPDADVWKAQKGRAR